MDDRLLHSLQSDLKTLSLESKKKWPSVKEGCEEGIAKLRTSPTPSPSFALSPVLLACESKDPKLVKLAVLLLQKIVTSSSSGLGGGIDWKGAGQVTNALELLLASGLEEIKVLQTVTLLLTTNDVVSGGLLAKNLVLAFRLQHSSKEQTTSHAAGATIRQLVALVFERIREEGEEEEDKKGDDDEQGETKGITEFRDGPAKDAYLLLQDVIALVNGEQPTWLIGITEMGRNFGLELVETILTKFPFVFEKYELFRVLLKEQVCALVIKLFSPNAKFKSNQELDRPFYPTCLRLLRIVDILLEKYYELLVTECEIFLSLLVRFLDPDKHTWQRCLALEVLHKLTTQPRSLAKFCKSYDLKPHATNICKDMMNAMGAYVQSVFATGSLGVSSSVMSNGSMANTPPGSDYPSGFYFRGSLVPLVQSYQPCSPKPQLMELTDKQMPPAFGCCESYGVAVSFACLSDFVLSLVKLDEEEDPAVIKQLLASSWPGMLAALNLLLDASIDDNITETICDRLVDLCRLSGKYGLHQCRESTVLSLCVATLPPHYGFAVLKGTLGHNGSGENSPPAIPAVISYSELDNAKQQVVVVGTSVVPSLALPPNLQSTPVMLTKKNLLVTHSVLKLCLESGQVLMTSWWTVLTTLQHLCWVCGVVAKSSTDFISSQVQKIGSGGAVNGEASSSSGYSTSSLGSGSTSSITAGVSDLSITAAGVKSSTNKSSANVMSAVVDFVSCLSSGVMKLIETSTSLDDVSLHHVINGLTQLSQEAMDIAYGNREPSLFAAGKLLEIGLVNLDRVSIYWRPLTNHLLEVCRHPHMRMRECGSEAISFLVRNALLHHTSQDGEDVINEQEDKMQLLLLQPLCELSSIPHNDVRGKQLMALNQILHSKGEQLRTSWPLAITIIGDIYESHSEGLIRSACQCLQLIVTDYLHVLPVSYVPQTIDTAAKFAKQKQELNVALSAVGLMWNISDFLFQNRSKIQSQLTASPSLSIFPDFPGVSDTEVPQFDRLWLGIYQRLGELFVDERPAVRKSAGQTLFSTISAHHSILSKYSWEAVLWQVLFILLEGVEKSWKSASQEKVEEDKEILIHHTRNTEQKQWSETQVLVLSGISKIFSTHRAALVEISDFQKAWFFFLEFIRSSSSTSNEEVSLAALKSFHEAITVTPFSSIPESISLHSWTVYLEIGSKVILPKKSGISQQFLTAYVVIAQILFQQVKGKLEVSDLEKLNSLFKHAITIPLTSEGASSILFTSDINSEMTALQEQIYITYDIIIKEALVSAGVKSLKLVIAPVILQLVEFGAFAVRNNTSNAKAIPLEGVVPNSLDFGIKCLSEAVSVLGSVCHDKLEVPLEAEFFVQAIKRFRPILSSRFLNPEGPWRDYAVQFFLAVPLIVDKKPSDPNFWSELSSCADEFLFFSSSGGDWMTKKGWKDEKMDVRMVSLLKDLVFQHGPPQPFLIQVVKIFHRGSCINEYDGINVSEREEFVRYCFSSLLEFVLKGPIAVTSIVENESGDIAVLALLQRFQNILLNYKEYVHHNSHIPIQRHRLAEMTFVLRAIASLIDSLKTADPSRGGTWEHIISIYPDLVALVGLPGVDSAISIALRDALVAYKDLLQLPDTMQHRRKSN